MERVCRPLYQGNKNIHAIRHWASDSLHTIQVEHFSCSNMECNGVCAPAKWDNGICGNGKWIDIMAFVHLRIDMRPILDCQTAGGRLKKPPCSEGALNCCRRQRIILPEREKVREEHGCRPRRTSFNFIFRIYQEKEKRTLCFTIVPTLCNPTHTHLSYFLFSIHWCILVSCSHVSAWILVFRMFSSYLAPSFPSC